MGEAKIIIAIKDGKVLTKVDVVELSQQDLAMLISSLELVRLEFLVKYKSNTRRFK